MKHAEELTSNTYAVTYQVDGSEKGVRLDSFLKFRYRKRSREQLKRAISAGSVRVRRPQGPHVRVGRLKPSLQLIGGDEVIVVSQRKPEPEVNLNYKILHEDDVLFVIEKPPNLPVHPAGRYFFNTLLTHLKTHGHGSVPRPHGEYFLVHRIDKETSGVLVLAKSKDSCVHLTRQFASRTTLKKYLAVVHGDAPDAFSIDAPMKRATASQISVKMMIAPECDGGAAAFTEFRKLKSLNRPGGSFSVLECFPKTGRQHQIRLHLEHAGHPIVGDKLYGRPEGDALRFYERQYISAEAQARLLLPRHALHAASISFEHPVSGERMRFHSELPKDLEDFLA